MQFLFLRMGNNIGTQEKICQDGLAILHYSTTTIHHLEEGSLQVLFIVSDPEVELFFYKTIFVSLNDIALFHSPFLSPCLQWRFKDI